MNYQIKVFHWPERGSHIILIVRGFIDIEGFSQIFKKIKEMTELLSDCKVLIDLVDAQSALDPMAIKELLGEFKADEWPSTSKLAMVSAAQVPQHNQILMLAASLSNRGYKAAAFYDSKSAVTWLTENI